MAYDAVEGGGEHGDDYLNETHEKKTWLPLHVGQPWKVVEAHSDDGARKAALDTPKSTAAREGNRSFHIKKQKRRPAGREAIVCIFNWKISGRRRLQADSQQEQEYKTSVACTTLLIAYCLLFDKHIALWLLRTSSRPCSTVRVLEGP